MGKINILISQYLSILRSTRGFTLIELLVVVAILTTIATAVIVGSVNVSRRAAIVSAESDLSKLADAADLMSLDTGGKLPGGLYTAQSNTCNIQNYEILLDDPCSGMLQDHPGSGCHPFVFNGGSYPNWNGPYVSSEDVLIDPWGTPYRFDPDYRCYKDARGCEELPNNTYVRAILSGGPNTEYSYTDGDNVVHILCK